MPITICPKRAKLIILYCVPEVLCPTRPNSALYKQKQGFKQRLKPCNIKGLVDLVVIRIPRSNSSELTLFSTKQRGRSNQQRQADFALCTMMKLSQNKICSCKTFLSSKRQKQTSSRTFLKPSVQRNFCKKIQSSKQKLETL